MAEFDEKSVPSAELSMVPGEERLKNFMELVQAEKTKPWESRLQDILDSFEDFLTRHSGFFRGLFDPAA